MSIALAIIGTIFLTVLVAGVMFFLFALLYVHVAEPLWDWLDAWIEDFKNNRRDSFRKKK